MGVTTLFFEMGNTILSKNVIFTPHTMKYLWFYWIEDHTVWIFPHAKDITHLSERPQRCVHFNIFLTRYVLLRICAWSIVKESPGSRTYRRLINKISYLDFFQKWHFYINRIVVTCRIQLWRLNGSIGAWGREITNESFFIFYVFLLLKFLNIFFRSKKSYLIDTTFYY